MAVGLAEADCCCKVWSLREEPVLVIGMDVLGTLPELVIGYQRKDLQLDLRLGRAPAS